MPLPIMGMIAGALGRGLLSVGLRTLGGGVSSAATRTIGRAAMRRAMLSVMPGDADQAEQFYSSTARRLGTPNPTSDQLMEAMRSRAQEAAANGKTGSALGSVAGSAAMLTAKLGALAGATSLLHRGFSAISDRTLQQAGDMRQYSSTINAAILGLQRYEIGRSIRMGGATGSGVSALASAVADRRRASEPLEAAMTNVSNAIQTAGAKMFSAIFGAMDAIGIDDLLNSIADGINYLVGADKEKGQEEKFAQASLRMALRKAAEGNFVRLPDENVGRPGALRGPRNDI